MAQQQRALLAVNFWVVQGVAFIKHAEASLKNHGHLYNNIIMI